MSGSHIKQNQRPRITGGWVRKGGVNTSTQTTKRPPAPKPVKLKPAATSKKNEA